MKGVKQMNFFQLRLQCAGRFSELDPDDQIANKMLIADLLSQVIPMHQSLVIIERLSIAFASTENLYSLHIDFWLDELTDAEEAEVRLEMFVGKALLQIFSEIAVVDDLNNIF
jgi:hypothetical protein